MANSFKFFEKTLYVLFNNPTFFFKRVFLELKSFLPLPKSQIIYFGGVKFPLDFSLGPKVKKMYLGTFQLIISEVFKK